MNAWLRNLPRTRLALWSLFGILLFLILLKSVTGRIDHDEIEHLHSTWKILQGETIYIDFFQHHHPFFYYLLVPLLAISPKTSLILVIARAFCFLLFLLVLWVTYLIAAKNFDKLSAVLALIFLCACSVFVDKVIEIRPDTPQTLFGLVSIYFLTEFYRDQRIRDLILSAVCLSVSFLFLQKALFLLVLILSFLAFDGVSDYFKHRSFNGLRYLVIFFLTFMVPLGGYWLLLLLRGEFSQYFTLNWTLNLLIRTNSDKNPLDLLQEDFYSQNTYMVLFYILSLFFYIRKLHHRRLGMISLGLLFAVLLTRAHQQYLMPVIPLMAIAAAYGAVKIFKHRTLAIVVIAMVVMLDYSLSINTGSNQPFRNKIDYVLSLTDIDGYVYDGDAQFNVFRKDVDFFWFQVRPEGALEIYQRIADYDYDIYQLIETYQPQVISTFQIGNLQDRRIADYYVQSPVYDDLLIRTHSKP
ncbi:MAG: glycosyltransferase family 39 protein [Symploca sp. SIO2G7]|nr:glycosyltransferase family 39 protein [Symploca sp. SIO2G7]